MNAFKDDFKLPVMKDSLRLSKHQFITILDIIRDLMIEQTNTAKALDTIFDDCHPVMLKLGNKTIDNLVDFLQADVNAAGELSRDDSGLAVLKDSAQDVAWYVWKCDMGASPKEWSFMHEGTCHTFLCDSHEAFYDSLVFWSNMQRGNV